MNDLIMLGKALADPTRIRILRALMLSELCVCELSDAMEMQLSTLSMHLQAIKQANLAKTERRHKWIYYSVDSDARPLLEDIFTNYEAGLNADKRLNRDADRINARLDLRVKGVCTLGAGQLDSGGGKS